MKKHYLAGLVICLIPLPSILYYLNSKDLIDWQLAVTLVFVEVPIGLLFHFLSKDKKESKEDRGNNKYDIKKLNNEIFKKLIHVICLESHKFFEGKFGFCVPKNVELIENKKDLDSRAWFVIYDRNYDIEKQFDRLEDVIPSIEIGEKYLQENYNENYSEWMKIKGELEQLNKERYEFFISVARDVGKDLEKELGIQSAGLLLPYGDNYVFFEDNIRKILDLLFKTRLTPLEIESDHPEQNYVRFVNSYPVIGSNKKERINLNAIEHIFQRVIYDNKLEEKHRQFHLRLLKLNSKISEFCYRLEKKVVNDIDNQI